MIFSLSRHGRKHWLTRLHCGGDKSLLIISYANFLTVFWQFSDDSKYLSSCHKKMITARICSLKEDAYVVQIANFATWFYMYYCRWQVTIYTLRFSMRALNRSFYLFFFWLFLLQKAEICWHTWKISISRLLWSDQWKLHREIQRHAIVIMYMFMTNDRYEDSFV